MFLVKCKCGSIFTLTKDGFKSQRTKCPSCNIPIPLDEYTSAAESGELGNVVEYVRCIPDDAKITVSFDA